MSSNEQADNNGVASTLSGKHVLLTGATGFLGKVILAKLLRSVPDIGGIHLLIRGSKQLPTARQRFEAEIASAALFQAQQVDDSSELPEDYFNKVHTVTGEITEECFGLPRLEFGGLTNRVDVIINAAASVDFREPLDQALRINALSLHNLALFAALGGNIPVLQVSTCYVNGFNEGVMAEGNVRPSNADLTLNPRGYYEVDTLIDHLQRQIDHLYATCPPESLKAALIDLGMREANLAGWNDTYTFTKWLGEQLLRKAMEDKPLTILRPSIIESTLSDPVPGWVEGVKVADAIILAYARGKTALFPGKSKGVLDVIPVDLVANSAILASKELLSAPAWHRVYQCCSGSSNPITLGEFRDHIVEEALASHERHPKLFLQKPRSGLALINQSVFNLLIKGRRSLIQIQNNLKRMAGGEPNQKAVEHIETTLTLANIYAFYTAARYTFCSRQLEALWQEQSSRDRACYQVSPRGMDWGTYIRDIHIYGLNRYAIKDRKVKSLHSSQEKVGIRAA